MPPADQFYGDRMACLQDPFGHNWMFSTHIEDVSEPELERRAKEMFGGFGSWFMASQHPQLFAAVAPVVGWGHPDLMPPIAQAQTPLWVFAAGRDSAINKDYFYPGIETLRQLGHYNMRFSMLEQAEHDAWRQVYAGQDLYEWLLQQQKPAE